MNTKSRLDELEKRVKNLESITMQFRPLGPDPDYLEEIRKEDHDRMEKSIEAYFKENPTNKE